MADAAISKAMAADGSAAASWRRYNTVAIFLHWAIGLMILALLASGIWMVDAIKVDETRAAAFNAYQVHKSIGLTVLALSILRLVWRILHPAPPLPEGMSALERLGAHVSHVGFYVLMIGMPISGWAMVSVSPTAVPTYWFWVLEIPHLPWLAGLAMDLKPAIEATLIDSHGTAGWIMIALLVLHVAAALKHHFVERDAVLARMAPGVAPRGLTSRPDVGPASFTASRVLASIVVLGAFGAGLFAVTTGAKQSGSAGDGVMVEMTAEAQKWAPVLEESAVNFGGEVDGVAFDGRFDGWSAQIAFDAESLKASEVMVEMDVTTATIDDPFYDEPMRGEAWFNAGEHPKATFNATEFEATGEAGQFLAKGTVTIRGVEQPATLPFSLTIADDRATAEGTVTLDRLAFGIGADPGPQAPTVSEEITVSIKVVADRAEE